MTRGAEAALLSAAVLLAAMGVALVNFAGGDWLDAQVALTLLVFAVAIGAIHVAVRRWAPQANPFLFPLAAFLTSIGFVEVYRLNPRLASIQRWSLLLAAAASAAVLWLLRNDGVAILRRYRYLFLAGAVALLLLPLLPASWPLRGAEVNGSRLWVRVDIGARDISFQPGELAKVFLVIFLASYLAERHVAMASVQRTIGRAGWVEAAVLVAAATGQDRVTSPDGASATARFDGSVIDIEVRCGEILDAAVLRSYCVGAAHMAYSWVTSESLTVEDGEVLDLTVRSFGIVRAVDTPRIQVALIDDDGTAINGSDAVFAAVAAAVWRHHDHAEVWPVAGVAG